MILVAGGEVVVVFGGGLVDVGGGDVPGVSGPAGPSVRTSFISGPVPSSGIGAVEGVGDVTPENRLGRAKARHPL